MKNRIKKFFIKKSSWTSTFTIILALIGLGMSFFVTQFSYQVISVMFVLIAVENFINQFTYMEDISEKLDINKKLLVERLATYMEDVNKKLDRLKPQSSTYVELLSRRNCKGIALTIQEAKHELFISGINLHTLSGFDTDIKKRAQEGIKIKILVFDINDKKLLESYENMVGRRIKGSTHTSYLVDLLNGCKNIEIRQVDFIMPAIYMAYDMDKVYGYIKVEHFLNNTDNTELTCIELTPDKERYRAYQENIEFIWKRGKQLQSC